RAGPTGNNGGVKPDVVAPGHHLGSNAKATQTLYLTYPSLRLDTGHMMLSGTSMASAGAAGAVAHLLQARRAANPLRPLLTPNAPKAIVQYSAIKLTDANGLPY